MALNCFSPRHVAHHSTKHMCKHSSRRCPWVHTLYLHDKSNQIKSVRVSLVCRHQIAHVFPSIFTLFTLLDMFHGGLVRFCGVKPCHSGKTTDALKEHRACHQFQCLPGIRRLWRWTGAGGRWWLHRVASEFVDHNLSP